MVASNKSINASSQEQIDDLLVKLQKLHRKELANRLDSSEELLVAVIGDYCKDKRKVVALINKLRDNFVDWNELRVSKIGEIARLIDPLENSEAIAGRIRDVLDRLFDRTGQLDLSFLAEMKIGEARRALTDIEPLKRAIVDCILVMEVYAASLPFSPEALILAKKLGLLSRSGNRNSFNKMLTEVTDRETSLLLYNLLEIHVDSGCTKSKCLVCKGS